MELIAVLHGQFSKGGKVLSPDGTGHFIHPPRHDTVCPVLEDMERSEDTERSENMERSEG